MFLFGMRKKKKPEKSKPKPGPKSKPKAKAKTTKAKPKPKVKAKKVQPKKVKASKKVESKKGGPKIAYLGIGSNVGDREEYIEQAFFLLGKTPGIKTLKRSANFETEAEGSGDQPQFLNAAVSILTSLAPTSSLRPLRG